MTVHLAGYGLTTNFTRHGVLGSVEIVVVIVRVFRLVVVSLQILTPNLNRLPFFFRWFSFRVLVFHINNIRRYVFKLL